MSAGIVQRIWAGDAGWPRIARAALTPLSAAYRLVVGTRNALYDAGALPTHPLAVPAISIGNVSVGGTGKTPVAAWVAAELQRRGAHPAIVLRGYGDDEPLVHRQLAPGVPVVVDADRVRGAQEAARVGADVVVLDDAFQHRRATRSADLVLVAAEQPIRGARVLPAGPLREPGRALRRASAVIVTRKSALPQAAEAVLDELVGWTGLPGAVVALVPDALVSAPGGESRPLDTLRGRPVLVVTGIGAPGAFVAQLEAYGAQVTLHAYPDHHAFSDADLHRAARAVPAGGLAVCTLKDMVKIGARWPGAGPLWYVSQRVVVERGADVLARILDRVTAERTTNLPTAGTDRLPA
ncbi:MAG TPA: tetraacyldisaccharide 4'-kinase [Gemmatimonadaceae bacterium]|jgi:tetraacyldisaccharide 4'-kinase|nr:tetraacyldisaccharide 4'-kinase [Gemmatimonadaceae bacterium]